VTGRDERHLVRADRAAGRLDAGDGAAVPAQEPGDLGVLDDVDAALARAGREPPRDPVVAGGAAPALQPGTGRRARC
jgi:hypothetical protein